MTKEHISTDLGGSTRRCCYEKLSQDLHYHQRLRSINAPAAITSVTKLPKLELPTFHGAMEELLGAVLRICTQTEDVPAINDKTGLKQ